MCCLETCLCGCLVPSCLFKITSNRKRHSHKAQRVKVYQGHWFCHLNYFSGLSSKAKQTISIQIGSWLQKHRISAQVSPTQGLSPAPRKQSLCAMGAAIFQADRHLHFPKSVPFFPPYLEVFVQREGINGNKQILTGMPNIQKSWTNGCCACVDKPDGAWHGEPDVP